MEPDDGIATLTDEEILTRRAGGASASAVYDRTDTGDDTGDPSDTADTGDDAGDTSDTADTGDDAGDTSDTGDSSIARSAP